MLFFDEIANGNKDCAFLEAADINADKAILAYQVARRDEDLRLREMEVKCVLEGCDGSALISFYEAGEENGGKEKGLLQKAWNALITFFKNLKEKLFGAKPNAEELPKTMKVPKPLITLINSLPNLWQNAKGAFANVKGAIANNKGVVALIAAFGAVGVGVYSASQNLKDGNAASGEEAEINTQAVIDAANTAGEITDTAEKFCEKCKNETQGIPEESLTTIQKIKSQIGEFGQWCKNALDALKAKLPGKNKGGNDKENQNTDENNDGNNNTGDSNGGENSANNNNANDGKNGQNQNTNNNSQNNNAGNTNQNQGNNNSGNNNNQQNQQNNNSGNNNQQSGSNNQNNNNQNTQQNNTNNQNGNNNNSPVIKVGKNNSANASHIKNQLKSELKNTGMSNKQAETEAKRIANIKDYNQRKAEIEKHGFTVVMESVDPEFMFDDYDLFEESSDDSVRNFLNIENLFGEF